MNKLSNYVERTVPDGTELDLFIPGRFFRLHRLSGATELLIAPDDDQLTPYRAKGGVDYYAEGTEFKRVRIKNASGGTCTFGLKIGYGREFSDSTVEIENAQLNAAVDFEAALKINDTLKVTPKPEALTVAAGGADISASVNYSGKRWLSAENTHATQSVTITYGGHDVTISPGQQWATVLLSPGESHPQITIDAAGSAASVEYINA
jgi:hypothetical protein